MPGEDSGAGVEEIFRRRMDEQAHGMGDAPSDVDAAVNSTVDDSCPTSQPNYQVTDTGRQQDDVWRITNIDELSSPLCRRTCRSVREKMHEEATWGFRSVDDSPSLSHDCSRKNHVPRSSCGGSSSHRTHRFW